MEHIAVYGAGTIGSGQATLIIGHGLPCLLVGRSQAGLERCRSAIGQNWDDLIEEGLASPVNKRAAMSLLTLTRDPADLAGKTFIFEAVAEDLESKRQVFRAIARYAAPEVVIASCSSSIDAEQLAALAERPENLLIAHPFQPVHLLPLVELVRHGRTSGQAADRASELLQLLHRQVVMLNRSVPGFLVNRLAQALFRESIFLLEEGVASAADIDRAVKYAMGMRYASIGLLEYYDDVGFQLERAIAENVYPNLCGTKEVQRTTLEGIAGGKTGRRVGRGLYDWSRKDEADFCRRKQAPYFEGAREWTMPE